MSESIKNIVIVGGGSAGWMTAATLISRLKGRTITLVESPNIPTIGVGESTLGFINNWLRMIDIKDEDFMKACDATYKLSIRFTDFYKKGSGSFHYPFGKIDIEGNHTRKNDWYAKKFLYPETPVSDYADCVYPIMSLVNSNKISDKRDIVPQYNIENDVAYHFDAVKFAAWLKSEYAMPKGVKNILAEVKHVEVDSFGVQYLQLDNGEKIYADLFIDCTGFKSLLIGQSLNEPFISYADKLPNNSAWAVQIPYRNEEDRRKLIVNYTDCHALGYGWVWNTPLWSRVGTGYVYSDEFVSDRDALEEFKEHLKEKGTYRDDLSFRNLKFRSGVHERLWVKNVVAIGLSAGFIEPLESNGLYSVHEFLIRLVRSLIRDPDEFKVNQFDKDVFSMSCRNMFSEFSNFVALHYAGSLRDDTPYWVSNSKRNWSENLSKFDKRFREDGFVRAAKQKMEYYELDDSGLGCVMTGLHYFPTDLHIIKATDSYSTEEERWGHFLISSKKLDAKRDSWKEAVKDEPDVIDYMRKRIYNDE